jgi:hypothetical protein
MGLPSMLNLDSRGWHWCISSVKGQGEHVLLRACCLEQRLMIHCVLSNATDRLLISKSCLFAVAESDIL